jgi:hypothetical protein
MEWAIATFGGKLCCIFASGCGGLANILTKREWGWSAIKDIGLSIIVGWLAAEFLIPAAMSHWKFSSEVAVGAAFLIGYCGIRLLPKLEEALIKKVSK